MANLLLIRKLCKERNITIRELSNKVGIGESAMQSLIKTGRTNTETLEKIAQELNVNAGLFFDSAETFINKDITATVTNGSSVIGSKVDGGVHHVNHTIAEETIKQASLGYQNMIIEYQKHTERLLTIIEKLTEKYESK